MAEMDETDPSVGTTQTGICTTAIPAIRVVMVAEVVMAAINM